MHGDEVTGMVLLLDFANYLLTNYGVAGPRGRHRTWWTTTRSTSCPATTPTAPRRTSAYNANGVDLNRNFPLPAGTEPTLATENAAFAAYADRAPLRDQRELPRRRPGGELPVGLHLHAGPGRCRSAEAEPGLLDLESAHVQRRFRPGHHQRRRLVRRPRHTAGLDLRPDRLHRRQPSRSRTPSGRPPALWSASGTTTARA